jgi:uncharacterized protein YcbX
MDTITVSALYIYPVKSCRAQTLTRAMLDARGLVGDRRFLVVDERGNFLTQRDVPPLALITSTVHDAHLTLARAGAPSVSLPLEPEPSAPCDVVVWRDSLRAVDLGDEAANWLHDTLGRPARLVGIGAEFSRPMRQAGARPGDEVAFADAHPFLLLSEASLADLNSRLDLPVPMNRFRPNVVVRGAAAFAEDAWRRIRIGSVILRASGPCARCVITTTNQETLERGKEPLRTLAAYRRGGHGSDVYFGQNYIHETKSGSIALDDGVEILE